MSRLISEENIKDKIDNYIKNTLIDMRNCNERLTYKNILSWVDKDEFQDIVDDEDLQDMIDASIEKHTTKRLQASDETFDILEEAMQDYVASTFDIPTMINNIVYEAKGMYCDKDPDVGYMYDDYELEVNGESVQEEIKDDILKNIDYNDLETFINDTMSEEDIIDALEGQTLQYWFEDRIDEILYNLDVEKNAQYVIEDRESELLEQHNNPYDI